jgi:hypothetical protein
MENGDVNVDSLEATFADGGVDVIFDVSHSRNCAECGMELKNTSQQVEGRFELEDVDGWKALPQEEKDRLLAALEDGTAEMGAEKAGTDVDESGGGRYKKNVITLRVEVCFGVNSKKGKVFKFAREFEAEVAASEYEECC